jgi:hypothetical protein
MLEKMMQLISELKEIDEKKEWARAFLVAWCQENSSKIKKEFPQKNKVYEIIDLETAFKYTKQPFKEGLIEGEKYYFKPNDIQFRPSNEFTIFIEMPSVKGELFDSDLNKVVDINYKLESVRINKLKYVEPEKLPKKDKNRFTYIYLMIDKNTGFYKIGRSVNPKIREKTLQSEKPTIEILHIFEGKMIDERSLHEMFYKKRIRGEWFDLSGSDIMNIQSYFNKDE